MSPTLFSLSVTLTVLLCACAEHQKIQPSTEFMLLAGNKIVYPPPAKPVHTVKEALLSLPKSDFAEASLDYYRAKVLRQKTLVKEGIEIVVVPGDALCPDIEWRWNRKTRELIINSDGSDLDWGVGHGSPPSTQTLRLDDDGWRRTVSDTPLESWPGRSESPRH